MSPRGTTLIELMVVVAILGILALIFSASTSDTRKQAAYIQSRERALQVLEYEADAITRGIPADGATTRDLLRRVPGATISRAPSGATTRLTVRWTSSSGRKHSQTLYVFGRPR